MHESQSPVDGSWTYEHPFTAHSLARLLLTLPDHPVGVELMTTGLGYTCDLHKVTVNTRGDVHRVYVHPVPEDKYKNHGLPNPDASYTTGI